MATAPPYSSTLVPEQETIQGRWNEFDSAIIDIYESGVPFYDSGIDYPADALTNEDGVLHKALVANGPDTSNAISPSADTAGTTWERLFGSESATRRANAANRHEPRVLARSTVSMELPA